MHTQRVGRLDIDRSQVSAELERSSSFAFSDAYSEYLCGGPWKSCMLWAMGGESGDGLVTNYDYERRPARTEFGEQLPYLSGLVESHFNLDHLTFARLAVISDSVIIPHRDLLELGDVPAHARNTHRVHVPLVTNDHCFFLDHDVVYRMRVGEVWFFDASSPHSAASLSREKRVHLLLDFSSVDDAWELLRFTPEREGGIPADSVQRRPPMSEKERQKLLALSSVIDVDNFREVFGIVIKKHYRKDGGASFIWNTFLEIARLSGNEELCQKAGELHRYFLIERAA